jgi:hypothetical protein
MHVQQAVAARIRQRREQHVVHGAEDRAIRADAERERQHDDQREPWRLAQRACSEADIVTQIVEHPHAPRIAALVFHPRHAPKIAQRRRARGRGVHAATLALAGLHLEMEPHFLVELAFDRAAARQRACAK